MCVHVWAVGGAHSCASTNVRGKRCALGLGCADRSSRMHALHAKPENLSSLIVGSGRDLEAMLQYGTSVQAVPCVPTGSDWEHLGTCG